MKVIVVAAVTVDGFIGHSLPRRLQLSSQEDLAEIMKLRAQCDAILVGAGTIRKDDSALITKDPELARQREKLGKCKDPIKVTVTRTGNISITSQFIIAGNCEKIVYATKQIDIEIENNLSKVVTVKKFDENNISARQIVEDLTRRNVQHLMVEGGTEILTMFFSENLVDELRLSVAPFFVGDQNAPRLLNSGNFFFDQIQRMKLCKVEQLGDTAVMHYSLNEIDH